MRNIKQKEVGEEKEEKEKEMKSEGNGNGNKKKTERERTLDANLIIKDLRSGGKHLHSATSVKESINQGFSGITEGVLHAQSAGRRSAGDVGKGEGHVRARIDHGIVENRHL